MRLHVIVEPGEIAVITSTINAHVNIEILDNFLIPSIENWFGDFSGQ